MGQTRATPGSSTPDVSSVRRPAAGAPDARTDTPSAAKIARIIVGQLGHRWKEVLLDDTAPEGLGETPWDLRHPVVLDTSAAQRLGYTQAGDYASTVAAEVRWLVAAAQGQTDADTVPADDDSFFARLLDYAAEDAYLAARA